MYATHDHVLELNAPQLLGQPSNLLSLVGTGHVVDGEGELGVQGLVLERHEHLIEFGVLCLNALYLLNRDLQDLGGLAAPSVHLRSLLKEEHAVLHDTTAGQLINNEFLLFEVGVDLNHAVLNDPEMLLRIARLVECGAFLIYASGEAVKHLMQGQLLDVLEIGQEGEALRDELLSFISITEREVDEQVLDIRDFLKEGPELVETETSVGAVVGSNHSGCARLVVDDSDFTEVIADLEPFEVGVLFRVALFNGDGVLTLGHEVDSVARVTLFDDGVFRTVELDLELAHDDTD